MNLKNFLGLLTLLGLATVAMAADQPASNGPDELVFKAPDHLLPLDGGGIGLYQGYLDFLKAVTPRSDNPQSSVYIWPSFKPAIFMAIYQTGDEKSYYLLYALATKPNPTVSTMPVPDAFAKAVSEKLEKIIRASTHYPSANQVYIECTDGTSYIFESYNLYGAAGCPAAGVSLQLEHVANDLVDLAELRLASQPEQKAKMEKILSELDATSY
ncbi:MAG TPA: hypothetical protein VF651_05915 [Gammaproteobacteria bacterium]